MGMFSLFSQEEIDIVAKWMVQEKIKSVDPGTAGLLLRISLDMLEKANNMKNVEVRNLLFSHGKIMLAAGKLLGTQGGVVIEQFAKVIKEMQDGKNP